MNEQRQRDIRAAIGFFRADRDAAFRALYTHIPDEMGFCAGCRTQRAHFPWPCVSAGAARRAIDPLEVRRG